MTSSRKSKFLRGFFFFVFLFFCFFFFGLHADSCILSILLDEDMRIKITDFGSAKIIAKDEPIVDDSSRSRSFVGSADFVSPEVLRNEVATTAYVYNGFPFPFF